MLLQVFYQADVTNPRVKRAQAVVHAVEAERLVVSGQFGINPAGYLETGMRAQMERAWTNLLQTLRAADFEVQDLVRITAYVTQPGRVVLFRSIAEQMLDGHACPCSYRQIAALETPDILFELEAEAVRDRPAEMPRENPAPDSETADDETAVEIANGRKT